jgi:hypothetical protein
MEIKRRREAYVCEGEERERGKTKCVYKTTAEVQTMLGMERGISIIYGSADAGTPVQ